MPEPSRSIVDESGIVVYSGVESCVVDESGVTVDESVDLPIFRTDLRLFSTDSRIVGSIEICNFRGVIVLKCLEFVRKELTIILCSIEDSSEPFDESRFEMAGDKFLSTVFSFTHHASNLAFMTWTTVSEAAPEAAPPIATVTAVSRATISLAN
jgi:hypothetical protein